jgi:VWFA-related protein
LNTQSKKASSINLVITNRRDFLRLTTSAAILPSVQDSSQNPTFSTEVKVVNVLATVRNKSGQVVRDLSKEDFVLLENGKPQTIRYFSRESDLPLTVGLLVDTSLSQTRVLENERGASYRFLEQVLSRKEDKAVVVQFDQAIVIRQNLTSSHKDLQDTLSLLDSPNAQQAAGGSGTLLYDAVRSAAIQTMRTQQGRKAFIVLTDGEDVGSQITLADAIEAAQRANTLVYCILFSDASYYAGFLGGGGGGKSVLERLSRETGGGFFAVSKQQGIEHIFNKIEEELRSEYSLGFVSNQPVTHSQFRKLHLTTHDKHLVVQATDRYYAET